MNTLPTNSRLETAFGCRASTVLPQADVRSDDAARGTALHAFLENVVKFQDPARLTGPVDASTLLERARDAAVAEAPETLREAMKTIPLDRLVDLDLSPDRCAVEVAHAYDVATGTARELGRGTERNYGDLSPTEYAGTIDFAQLLGEGRGRIRDWKFGSSRRTPARENPQMLKGALDFARTHDLREVEVEIVRWDQDGVPWFDSATLSIVDLDAFAFRLEDLHKRIEKDRADYEQGLLPRCTVSEHCRFCPAARFCPAQSNLARSLVDETTDVSQVATKKIVLTDDLMRQLVVQVPIAEKRLEEIKRAMKLFASQTPVSLPDGLVYGPRPDVRREIVDVELAKQVLTTKLGAEPAAAALSPAEMTMDGVERARKAYFLAHPEEKKVKGAVGKMDEEIEAALHAAGALRMRDAPVVTIHKPKAEK